MKENAKEKDINWVKPRPGSYKLNIDASYHVDGSGAVGVVLRNYKGEAIAGMAHPMDHIFSAATAEALALLKGLKFIEQLGDMPVTIESDSLEQIQACNGVIEVWSPYSAIMVESFVKE